MGKRLVCAATLAASCFFAGCIAMPGQEPFGEHTYTDSQAQLVCDRLQEELAELQFDDWGGYSIELAENTIRYDFYYTEAYTTAWHEGKEDYLWYEGRLYCHGGETLSFRDMDWAALGTENAVQSAWDFACALLERDDGELRFKHIPMAEEAPYLLTAEYPETEWESRPRRGLKLSFGLDGNKSLSSFTLRWQEKGSAQVIGVSFFPLEGSARLLAERRIWSFASNLGLLEEGVPAISEQKENRKRCQAIISSIDFDSILEQAIYQENLEFPIPPEIRTE